MSKAKPPIVAAATGLAGSFRILCGGSLPYWNYSTRPSEAKA